MPKSKRKTARNRGATANGHIAVPASAPPTEAVAEPVALPRSTFTPRQSLLITVALCLCIAIGIGCRFIGVLAWDEGAHLHPDERFLTMVVPELKWPHSVTEYFDTQHAPLNPINYENAKFFVYGQLPLYLGKIAAIPWHADDYDGILRVGRVLSALFDTGTVFLIFLIGRRIGGHWIGLLGAALLAAMPLHIQLTHFYTVDTFTAFFITAAFLCFLRWHDALTGSSATWPTALLTGTCWGAAMACKISAALFLALIVPAIALLWYQHKGSRVMVRHLLGSALLLLVTAFLTFRVAHPMAFAGRPSPLTLWGFLDVRPTVQDSTLGDSPMLQSLSRSGLLVAEPTPQFWSDAREQERITSGEAERVWDWQWIGRRNYLWPLRNLMLWAVGWPVMLAGIAGVALILWRTEQRQAVPFGMQAAAWWVLFSFLYQARIFSKFTRYYIIGTPFLALCAAYGLLLIWRYANAPESPPTSRRIALVLNGGVLAGAVLWAIAVTSIYTRPHTRIEASRWIRANIAPGTPILNETGWDDTLPISDTGGLRMSSLELYDNDSPEKRQRMIDLMDQSQWIFVSSQRGWQSIPRAPQRWPLTTAYYHALFTGQLGYVPTQEFASYPQLNLLGLHLQFPDDTVEEALSVYDHPRVVLFQKTAAWSRQRAEQLLDPALLGQVNNAPLSEIRDSGWRPDESSLPWLPSPSDFNHSKP